MTRLRYNPAKGWFTIIDFVVGTVDFRTGEKFPDKYGCLKRHLIVGPYTSAPEALRETGLTLARPSSI